VVTKYSAATMALLPVPLSSQEAVSVAVAVPLWIEAEPEP